MSDQKTDLIVEGFDRKAAIAAASSGEIYEDQHSYEQEAAISVKDELDLMDKEDRIWRALEDMKAAETDLGTRFLRSVHPQDMIEFLEKIYTKPKQ